MDNTPEKHEMVLEKQFDSGAEEWYCPTCGRRFIMQWPPEFKRVILEPGDEYAVHTAGKGIPGMVSMQMDTGMKTRDTSEASLDEASENEDTFDNKVSSDDPDDERLAPWLDWMESNDFDRLWDEEDQ
jgi:hypothetical protein